MRVQVSLVALGYYSGPVNGVMGSGTKDAIKRFQKDKGLTVTGTMSTETLNMLGVAAVQ